MTAVARDEAGRVTSATIEWTSSNPLVVTVERTTGIAVAVAPGSATVTAASGALRAQTQVSVIDPGVAVLAFTRLDVLPGPRYETTADLMVLFGQPGVSWLLPGDESSAIITPAWAPDRDRLAVTLVQGEFGEGAGYPGDGLRGFEVAGDIFLIPFASAIRSQWVQLTHDGWSRFPDWSPDGQRIVYVSGPPGHNHIYSLAPTGGQPTRLTAVEGHYAVPRWSPDDQRIAFTGRVAEKNDDIFVMNADGSGLINVTSHPSLDAAPSWSPDGLRLAFGSNRQGPLSDIYVIELSGGTVSRLTVQTAGISNELPAWSPDGAQIAFSRIAAEEALHPGIYMVSIDGTHLLQLSAPRDGFTDHFPAWRR